MIHVRDLTKRYRRQVAVDAISFDVEKGEVVGFLGPNGAGKTTTMRILAGFLAPTSGEVRIAGFDMATQSLQGRLRIGYMPENVPLYGEMRVKEYLRYRAQLKGMEGKAMRVRVGEVMDLCGVTEVRRSLIDSLSKGYRQRVGLADALVHEPELLILDEPTNGLDPNQIRQVRELIRNLAKRHTVLLSTHILPEVEMTCGRAIIIDRGRIKASGTMDELGGQLRGSGIVRTQIKGDPKELAARLKSLPSVKKVAVRHREGEWTSLELRVNGKADTREAIHRVAVEEGWAMRELTLETAQLEDVFAELTAQDRHG